MQAMNSSRRQWQGRQGHGRFGFVIAGPRAGMVVPVPAPSSFATVLPRTWAGALLLDDDDEHLLGGRSSKRARVAAASETILQEVTARDALQLECAICLDDFGADERLAAMPSCSHAFHHRCISEWLHRKAACPLCRQRLPAAPTAP